MLQREIREVEKEFIEVMVNTGHGQFSFSEKARDRYWEIKGSPWGTMSIWEIDRTDPFMIQVVKELGDAANGTSCRIELELVPKEFEKCYVIEEYDGSEWIEINYKKWKLDQIEDVINNFVLTGDAKEMKIREILRMHEPY